MVRSSLLILSVCATSSLLAQEGENNEELAMLKSTPCECAPNAMPTTMKERVALLESQMQEVFTGTQLGDCGAKVASARPQINSNRIFFKVDTFLWKAFVGGNDYAVADTLLSSSAMIGDVKRADFRWRWGFRAETGYHLPHDIWDVLANYTWFHDKSDKSAVSPSGGTIVPLIAPFADYGANASSSIRWNIHFQNLDIDLRRCYFLSRSFSIAPFFGLRNSWIDQKYAAHYVTNTTPAIVDVDAKQDFWGIGPVAGIGTEWHFTSQWWLFGSFAGAILAADYDVSSQVINSGTTLMDIDANTHRMSPTMQGSLGFGWHMNFNRDRNHVALRLLYEAQYWWKQNLTINYAGTSATYQVSRLGDDLGMHGFTFDMLFDF